MTQRKNPTVKQNEKAPIPFEVLADDIHDLAAFGRAISKSRLKKHTILLLLKDATGIPMNNIQKILDALPELETRFCK